jgi:hypothetical protein
MPSSTPFNASEPSSPSTTSTINSRAKKRDFRGGGGGWLTDKG